MKVYCEHYKTCKHDESLLTSDLIQVECKLINGCDDSIVYFQDNGKPYCAYHRDYINLKTEFEVLMEKTIAKSKKVL